MNFSKFPWVGTFVLYLFSASFLSVEAQDSDPFSKQSKAPSAMRTREEIAASLEHLVPDGLNLPRERKLCDLCHRGPVNPEHTEDHRMNHCTKRASWISNRISEILAQEQTAERQKLEANTATALSILDKKVENLEKLTEKKAPIEIVSKVDLLKTETSSLKKYLTKEIEDLKTALEDSKKNRALEIQTLEENFRKKELYANTSRMILEKKISNIVYFGSAIAFSLTTFYVYSLYSTQE